MTEAGEGEVFIDETHQTPAGNRTLPFATVTPAAEERRLQARQHP